MNSLAPALPDPSALDAGTVAALGAQLVAWAESADDIAVVSDAAARWAAITEYIRRTSREGVAEAEGALRRLEVRVGVLLGPATVGAHSSATEGAAITADARHDFRTMAEHVEVVERVIAESSDESPPSRRKVLARIAAAEDAADFAAAVAEGQELAPRILAALAALPPERMRSWIVVLRIDALDQADALALLPDDAEVVQIRENAA